MNAKEFLSTLETHGPFQYVQGPTHVRGHTLDVLISRESGSLVSCTPSIEDPHLFDSKGNPSGDHFAVHCQLNLTKPQRIRKTVSFRRYNKIAMTDLEQDLRTTLHPVSGSVDEQLNIFESDIRDVIDKHAPLVTKEVVLRPNSPWYTDELRALKRERRKAERRWRRTKLTIHHEMFLDICEQSNKVLLESKTCYFREKIEAFGNDSKRLFALTKNLMGNSEECILPKSEKSAKLANQFCEFFLGKIATIRDVLAENCDLTNTFCADTQFNGDNLSVYTPASEDEIKKIILSAPTKSCE
ncbi:hypothetical protein FSP39_015750 [Pinctada imbricata]|uniref:Uncharacterized protein n=1 Tax=Pinctada imbricata TaxID=66713 RepID=A0AA89C3G9_PINIB|nr:hypothetical protein FSP39_015750 [Pinctada imbricata]